MNFYVTVSDLKIAKMTIYRKYIIIIFLKSSNILWMQKNNNCRKKKVFLGIPIYVKWPAKNNPDTYLTYTLFLQTSLKYCFEQLMLINVSCNICSQNHVEGVCIFTAMFATRSQFVNKLSSAKGIFLLSTNF